MPAFEIVSTLVLVAIVWLWFDSVKAREIAMRAAKEACAAQCLQFLDETVAIASLRLARDEDGRLLLRRTYSFEYSESGNDRRPGSVTLLGQEVLMVSAGLRIAGAE